MRHIVPAAVVTAMLGSACGYDQGTDSLERFDPDVYARDVQPIFEARCATLDCHGDPGRPLRLFAETGLRMRDDLRDLPITADELLANVGAAEGVDPGAQPARSLILRKPLAEAAGGVQHEGGDLWLDRNEAQVVCVEAWLAGESDEVSARDACVTAAAEVELPPEE